MQRIEELTAQRDELLKQIDAHRVSELAKLLEERYPSTSVGLSIQQAVDEFHDFFVGYTDYFWHLQPGQLLGHGRTYELVLSSALENMRELWRQFSLAINQRFNPVYQEDLKQADEIAKDILEQVRDVVHGMPILYFEKTFQISRHPYQTYPLLGISLERFALDGVASLAHELGHHVFWNNGDLDEYAARLDAIHKELASIILPVDFPPVDFVDPAKTQRAIQSRFDHYDIWAGWIEEVFADVFGTLIAGPRFAKSAQDILIREHVARPGDLLANDGEHPTPALRPQISLAVLQVIADQRPDDFGSELTALVTSLRERWQPNWKAALAEEQQGASRGSAITHVNHRHTDGRPTVTLEELRDRTPEIVGMVLSKLLFTVGATSAGQQQNVQAAINHWGKSRDTAQRADIRKMMVEVAGDRLAPIPKRAAPPEQTADRSNLQGEAGDLFGRFLDFVRARQKSQEGRMPTEEWEAVLEFDLSLQHEHYHGKTRNHAHTFPHVHTQDSGHRPVASE